MKRDRERERERDDSVGCEDVADIAQASRDRPLLWVAVGLAAGLLLGGLLGVFATLKVMQKPGFKLPSKAEFTAKVLGKTKDEVIAAVGRPSTTMELGGESWLFPACFYNEATGKPDGLWINFDRGNPPRAERVHE